MTPLNDLQLSMVIAVQPTASGLGSHRWKFSSAFFQGVGRLPAIAGPV
jgi:hypothetical protein